MSKKKILIAEDDTGILEAMQIMLEDAGYDVRATTNGSTVLDMKDDLPDLFLLDIWMSGIDGTTICKKLKSQDTTKHIPIIMCSANRETEKLTQACGANDFIAKPFEMEELLDKVEKYSK